MDLLIHTPLASLAHAGPLLAAAVVARSEARSLIELAVFAVVAAIWVAGLLAQFMQKAKRKAEQAKPVPPVTPPPPAGRLQPLPSLASSGLARPAVSSIRAAGAAAVVPPPVPVQPRPKGRKDRPAARREGPASVAVRTTPVGSAGTGSAPVRAAGLRRQLSGGAGGPALAVADLFDPPPSIRP